MQSRNRVRENEREIGGGPWPIDDAYIASYGQGDSILSLPGRIENEPFGGGTESTIAADSTGLVASWRVPRYRQGEIDEIAVAGPSGATVTIYLRELSFGPFSGSEAVTAPFNGAHLSEGDLIKVMATADVDGPYTVKAQLTGRLF
jgi:hypothetical protein